MLYCLVAAGAFGIEEMISESGPGMTLLLLIAFPFIWSFPISNMVAECSSLLPAEGGVYAWAKEAFGEFWGFQAGWWETMSSYICNGTYVALVAGYVSQLLPMSDDAIFALKVGMIVIFTVVNLLGLRGVEKASTFLSICIVLAFALVAVVGFLNWQTNPVDPFIPAGSDPLTSMGAGLCICVWMYCGYERVSNMAGEIKDVRVIPRGLLIAMPLVALSYILPTIAGLASMPAGSWELWATDGGFSSESLGYASVLTMYLGDIWGYVFLVAAILSQCAMFNTYLAAGSRGLFVLADDNLCPKILVKVSKKRGVPYIGILSLSAVTLVLAQSDFTTLVSMEVMFILALYVILPLAVVKLRKKYPVDVRKRCGLYVMPGGNPALLFFCGFPFVISIFAMLTNGTDYLTLGLIAMASGPVVYVIMKRLYGGLTPLKPEEYPLNPKTKLAQGDITRIGVFMMAIGAFSFLGQFWLRWYELDLGGWGPADYATFSNVIPQVHTALAVLGLVALLVGVLLYLHGRKHDKVETDLLMEEY